MPTTKDEPWRRTDLRRMAKSSFHLPDAKNGMKFSPVPEDLLIPLVGERQGGQLVQTPGGETTVELDPDLRAQGVVFTDLKTAAEQHPEILADILGKVVNQEDGKFAALAGALAPNGVLVYVPRGVQVEIPLHSVFWAPGAGLAHFSHLLIWLEEGSSLTYVHESASPPAEDGQSLHGGVVEIMVGAGANLRFVELPSWGSHIWNFTHERARVGRDGLIDWIYGGLGSQVTKSFLDLELEGTGATGRMSGFFFTNDTQHIDLDTQQNHLAPNTNSDLLYKGALSGSSRAVWQGMIYVAPGAQQTDGYQANRNLILSESARADSIPGLEILADDVRCTHGATIGKIDPDLLFYLRTRGISESVAERLIVEGFFEPIMQRIPFEGVRDRFKSAIIEKMGKENGS
jgi:Fe-S cluster assembly protein SufD